MSMTVVGSAGSTPPSTIMSTDFPIFSAISSGSDSGTAFPGSMRLVDITGACAVLVSDVTLEDWKRVEKYAPEALKIVDEEGEPEQDKFALTSTLMDELFRKLGEVTVEREWGECERYWYADCDFELCEIYCWDTADWLLYGFTYSVDGDEVVIDFESKKRKKYTIVDFDEGTQKSPFADMFARLEQKLQDSAEWETKYNTASDKITDMEAELTTLREFKSDIEAEAQNKEREAVMSRFSKLDGVEAFESLRAEMSKYDIDTLEEKCYAILGRMNSSAKFALETKSPKLPVGNTKTDEPYGGIFAEYGIAD